MEAYSTCPRLSQSKSFLSASRRVYVAKFTIRFLQILMANFLEIPCRRATRYIPWSKDSSHSGSSFATIQSMFLWSMLSRLGWRIWVNGTTRLMTPASILFLMVRSLIFIFQLLAHSRTQFLTQHINCHISKLCGILNGSRLAKSGCEKLWVYPSNLSNVKFIMI